MPSVVACDMSGRFKKSAFIAFQDLEKCTASTNLKKINTSSGMFLSCYFVLFHFLKVVPLWCRTPTISQCQRSPWIELHAAAFLRTTGLKCTLEISFSHCWHHYISPQNKSLHWPGSEMRTCWVYVLFFLYYTFAFEFTASKAFYSAKIRAIGIGLKSAMVSASARHPPFKSHFAPQGNMPVCEFHLLSLSAWKKHKII